MFKLLFLPDLNGMLIVHIKQYAYFNYYLRFRASCHASHSISNFILKVSVIFTKKNQHQGKKI